MLEMDQWRATSRLAFVMHLLNSASKPTLNITLINAWRVINAKGGTEKVFCNMANALAQRGHNVTAICCDTNDGNPGFPLDERVSFVNVGKVSEPIYLKRFVRNIRSIHFYSEMRNVKRVDLTAESFKCKIQTVLSEIDTDVFVSFQAESTLAIKKLVGDSVPVVTMLHGHPNIYPLLKMYKHVLEKSVIQVLRPEYVEYVRTSMPSARIVYMPNIGPQVDETADRSSKTIIHVGRISQQKRQLLLVEAFASLKERFSEWKVEMWGEYDVEKSYTDQVRSMIENHGLNGSIRLCGPTNEIPEKLIGASIFAFPSWYEGFPLAMTEAMSVGLPVIGCKECPGVNSIIRDGRNGTLCESTPKALADALEKLMSDEFIRVRFGNAAKEDMKAYAPNCIWDQWETLIETLK